jgi:RNA polymerase sigma factor (sigma-70 family)
VGSDSEQGDRGRSAPTSESARKRAAIETYSRHEAALRRTARRFSLCADDAEDAVQRAFEILLRKAPTEDPRELIRWTQTVVKHEALAVRRDRERILGGPAGSPEPDGPDWLELIPAEADGPAERAERREAVARSREALQALKPQELRALALLAEGYSYAEIGEITGYSKTKINRCLAEGRERFRRVLSRSEDGSRCAEMRPAISAFCDGEAGPTETAALREHLRACSACRATLRAYRAAPAAAAALVPALPVGRSLLGRAHDALTALAGRFGGGGATDSTVSQIAATGGTRGAGAVAVAKAIGLCIGTAGGAAACAATGVIPVPFEAERGRPTAAKASRQIAPVPPETEDEAPSPSYEAEPEPAPDPQTEGAEENSPPAPESSPAPPAASSGAVEYAPPPPPATPAATAPPASAPEAGGGDPAGEFGP